jgi:hypothetical protein
MKPLILAAFLAIPWCDRFPVGPSNGSSDVVQVRVQSSAPVAGGTIRFDSLLTDSRCPTGMMCYWEGEAVIRVQWTRMTRTADFTLKLSGSTTAQHSDAHIPFDTLGYRFTLQQLDPYPDPNIRIAYGAYLATIRVESLSRTVRR